MIYSCLLFMHIRFFQYIGTKAYHEPLAVTKSLFLGNGSLHPFSTALCSRNILV
jgi:hypothetical protein